MQQKPPSRKHSVSKTSNNWKKEHFDDQYVKQSWQDGYRSRASYKLLELDEKDKLFRNGMTIIDLGQPRWMEPNRRRKSRARGRGHRL